MNTFIDKCVNDEESIENIERYVIEWANLGMPCELHEFLGFKNILHYKMYMEDKSFLYNYISKIKKWNSLSDLEKSNLYESLIEEVTIYSILKKNIENEDDEDDYEDLIDDE